MRHLGWVWLDQDRFAKIAKVWHTSGCRLQGVVALDTWTSRICVGNFQHFSSFLTAPVNLSTSGLNPPQRPLEHRFLPLSAPETNFSHRGEPLNPAMSPSLVVWAMVPSRVASEHGHTRPLRTP